MRKIKIYVFCKDRFIEWEIYDECSDFILEKHLTYFKKDYKIRFKGDEIVSSYNYKINYKGENVDSHTLMDGDTFLLEFPEENGKVVLFIKFLEGGFLFSKFDISGLPEIKIGKSGYCDISYDDKNVLDYHIVLKSDGQVVSNGVGAYLNGRRFEDSNIKFGDTIFLYGLKVVYLGDFIGVSRGATVKLKQAKDIKEAKEIRFLSFDKKNFSEDTPYFDFKEDKRIFIEPPNLPKGKIFKSKRLINKTLEDYSLYLNRKHKEIVRIKEEGSRALFYKYPVASECYKRVINLKDGLWSRNPSHDDFLTLNIGHGQAVLNNIKLVMNRDLDIIKDKTYDEVINNYNKLKKSPIVIPLKKINKLSLVSNMGNLYEVFKSFIVQMTSLTPPDDLKIFLITSKENKDSLYYMKEIPHVYSKSRYIAIGEDESIHIIYKIKSLIRDRENILKENKDHVFKRGYVVTLFYFKSPIIDEFLQYIKGVNPKVNVSFILLTVDIKNVPDYFKYLLHIYENYQILHKRLDNGVKRIELSNTYKDELNLIDIDKFTRALSMIKDEEGALDLSFHSLYGSKNIYDIDIKEKWDDFKSLSLLNIPVAFTYSGYPFILNMHKKREGIFGVIYNNENKVLLKTLILSYGIYLSPKDLNFIILKSNKDFNDIISLPHIIDILDKDIESEKRRFLDIITKEIKNRYEIFKELKINNIDEYSMIKKSHDLYDMGNLFIVIDDINKNDIEFINSIMDLKEMMEDTGVYLILSSEDNIPIDEGKMDFKIRFKNFKDTFDFIGRDGEVHKDMETILDKSFNFNVVDNTGNIIDKILFNKRTFNEDFKVILDKIREISKDEGEISPFNSSMRYLILNDLSGYESNFNGFMWNNSEKELCVIAGIIDDSKNHVQRFLNIDFKNKGNVLIVGKNESGKSNFIKTIVYSTLCEYKESHVNIYMVDKGGESYNFIYAPHVKGVGCTFKEAKILINKVFDEFNLRRKVFDNLGISSIDDYNLIIDEKLPYIILTIDDFNSVYDDHLKGSADFKNILRYGKEYGIFLCLASNEEIKDEILFSGYFGEKFLLKVNNPNLYKAILGEEISLGEKFSGRGALRYKDSKGSRVLEFQVACQMYGKNTIDINNKLKQLFIQMDDINKKIYSNDIDFCDKDDEIYDESFNLRDLIKEYSVNKKSMLILSEGEGLKEFLEKIYYELTENGINSHMLKGNDENILDLIDEISSEEKSKEAVVFIDNINLVKDIEGIGEKIKTLKDIYFIVSMDNHVEMNDSLSSFLEMIIDNGITILFDGNGDSYLLDKDTKRKLEII